MPCQYAQRVSPFVSSNEWGPRQLEREFHRPGEAVPFLFIRSSACGRIRLTALRYRMRSSIGRKPSPDSLVLREARFFRREKGERGAVRSGAEERRAAELFEHALEEGR